MKKNLLSLLLVQGLLSPLLQPAFGQSPWVIAPTAPNFYATTSFNVGANLHSASTNVLWGTYARDMGQGSTSAGLFISTDSGLTWQTQGIGRTSAGPGGPSGGYSVADIEVLDGQNMWVLKKNVAANSYVLMRTTSGAAGLADLPNQLPAAFSAIHFFTATTGVAVVLPAGAVYRTTDGGSSWTLVTTTIPAYAGTSNDYLSAKQGLSNSFWLTTNSGALLRTADAGLTWTSAPNIGKVAFEDALNGLAYQDTGLNLPPTPAQLLRTTDGGQTWATVPFSGQPLLGGVAAIPNQPGTYISVGYRRTVTGYLYTIASTTAISRDWGNTWQTLATDGNLLTYVVALNAGEIWATPSYDFGAAGGPPANQPMVLNYTANVLAAKNGIDPARQLFAYPNPTNGLVQLAGPLQGKEKVRVYDAAGRLCQQGQVSETGRTLDLSAQPAGLYQLQVTAGDGSIRSQRLNKVQ